MLLECEVLVPGPEYGRADELDVERELFDLVVVTQTCDLVNPPAPRFVACCPLFPLELWREVNPDLASNSKLNEIASGRLQGLHLLPPADHAHDELWWSSMIVDFRDIYDLPFEYLSRRAVRTRPRLRLASPYLEHFSQAFALHFMRVALPLPRPRFKGTSGHQP
ncbi:MAG: hypothetical protein M5U22_18680 [Thermoleophilia bacterium]|nr:hypothetical protein [Thermoleophilia bacterium]